MTVQELKEAIRERDGRRCTDCGITQEEIAGQRWRCWRGGKKLDVHRIIADGPYSFENCKTLCRSCHCQQRRDYILVGVVRGRKRFIMTEQAKQERAIRKWLREEQRKHINAVVADRISSLYKQWAMQTAVEIGAAARANGKKAKQPKEKGKTV